MGCRAGIDQKFSQAAAPLEAAVKLEAQNPGALQDGWIDLFVTTLDHEFYSLYQNKHDETFEDRAISSGIGKATEMISGWGLKFFDYDNDGNLDLMIANGHPDDLIEKLKQGVGFREPLLLFQNTGKGLQNVTAQSGSVFATRTGRGAWLNDGAVGVLVSMNDAPPLLLKNEAGTKSHWLGVSLIGTKANSDAVGAIITYQAGDMKRTRTKVAGSSYLSYHDPRLVLGIGQRTKIDWIEVKWPQPSGTVERFADLPLDRYVTIVEGQGKWK